MLHSAHISKKSPPGVFRLGVSFRENAPKGTEEVGQLGDQIQQVNERHGAQEGVEGDRREPARFGGAGLRIIMNQGPQAGHRPAGIA